LEKQKVQAITLHRARRIWGDRGRLIVADLHGGWTAPNAKWRNLQSLWGFVAPAASGTGASFGPNVAAFCDQSGKPNRNLDMAVTKTWQSRNSWTMKE
jgi:hypothetical protein